MAARDTPQRNKQLSCGRLFACLTLGVGLGVAPGSVPAAGTEAWPTKVDARYALTFNGIKVGHIAFASQAGAQSYTLNSTGEVSVLFGAIKWAGTSRVSGVVANSVIAPNAYVFDWKKNKKGGAISLGFTDRKATQVSVEPPAGTGPEYIALTEKHKTDVLDPLSAIMALTRADVAEPCERRVHVFDGKQRFDVVFSPKRKTVITSTKPGVAPAVGFVCRAMYEPIAGHRNNADQKAYANNRDAEVVLRRLPGTGLLVPHSVTVPTAWGTGTMVIERMTITSAAAGQFAVTE
jgi:hypothetical protein